MDIIGYIKEYFSRASDFVGEEQGETYRRYCIIQSVGFPVYMFGMRLIARVLYPILQIEALANIFVILYFVGFIIWIEPAVAATVRRTWTQGRSKLWVLLVIIPFWSLIAWLFLGADPEK
ncbi:DUF805 domain-containing protein [Clostridium sp.]